MMAMKLEYINSLVGKLEASKRIISEDMMRYGSIPLPEYFVLGREKLIMNGKNKNLGKSITVNFATFSPNFAKFMKDRIQLPNGISLMYKNIISYRYDTVNYDYTDRASLLGVIPTLFFWDITFSEHAKKYKFSVDKLAKQNLVSFEEFVLFKDSFQVYRTSQLFFLNKWEIPAGSKILNFRSKQRPIGVFLTERNGIYFRLNEIFEWWGNYWDE
jgi:hypothetical protein